MEEKPDERLKKNFPRKEIILRQIVEQIRRTFSQNLGGQVGEKERASATCKTVVSAFHLYLIQLTQAETQKLLYNHFINEVLEMMPELGLGDEITYNSWQCIFQPFVDGIIYPD